MERVLILNIKNIYLFFSGDVYKKRVGTLEKRGVNHICAIIKNNSNHMRCIDFVHGIYGGFFVILFLV